MDERRPGRLERSTSFYSMSNFGTTLFSGSRFIFWCLAPVLVGFVACLLVLAWTRRDTASTVGLFVFTLLSALLIVGLWNPLRNRWALRCVTGMVFLAYVGYLVAELVRGADPSPGGPRSTPSVWNAILGLFIIGIPSLVFTLRGRFGVPDRDDASDLEDRVPGPDDLHP